MKTRILDDELAPALPHCADEGLVFTAIRTAKEARSKIPRCGMTCPFDLLAISDFVAKRPDFPAGSGISASTNSSPGGETKPS
jgi:hypothetical protein